MSVSAENLLFEAIKNSWIGVVQKFLDNGGDPNLSISTKSLEFGQFRIMCQEGQSFKPLHAAISKFCRRMDHDGEDSLKIIDILLEKGASLSSQASFTVVRLGGYSYSGPHETYRDYTPLDFCFWLTEQKELKLKSEHTGTRVQVDSLIAKLVNVSNGSTTTTATTNSSTVSMPRSVIATYKKLLLDSDYSDVTFVCENGEEIHAHKAILATASPYFAAAFAGPWSENDNGKWNTSHSLPLMKAVLAFVYTGDVEGVRENPMNVLAIAEEFDISSLKQVATTFCIDSLSVENFAATLQVAHLYNIVDLKEACHGFARRNLAAVLTNRNVMNLPNENEAVWTEFKSVVAP